MFPFVPVPRHRANPAMQMMQIVQLQDAFESMAIQQQALNVGRVQGYATAVRDMDGVGESCICILKSFLEY